ncbi:MAG TPA: N-acetylmuramoyl-L-alanine amidase [Chitinophagaceae bacterium]|nr:N-acetylmuramoyl-L-alanine amidase [Chitinophagaceae bacterium]
MILVKNVLVTAVLVFPVLQAFSQQSDPFIRITQPLDSHLEVTGSPNYVAGSTCRGCVLTLNGDPVRLYPTGAFAIQLDLVPGDTMFNFEATLPGKKLARRLYYDYAPVPPEQTDSIFGISQITTFPEGNLELSPGDVIRIRVKGYPGCKATWLDGQPLYEQPPSMEGGIGGIYQGSYTVKLGDSLLRGNIQVTLSDIQGQQITRSTPYQFSLFGGEQVGITKGQLPFLVYGLGTDRLGGAKMGYLDTAVLLRLTGKFNNEYRVKLSEGLDAYIPQQDVTLLPEGSFSPQSLTGPWKIYGDGRNDYVSIALSEKLPYRSIEDPDPSQITVDLYGATANTNWITQLRGIGEIRSAYYEQVQEGVFRIHILLKNPLSWGYSINYHGNDLVIRVKHPPAAVSLAGLKIAIDPGHGGSNLGALSPTGVYEKELTLEVAFDLKAALEKAGARVIMTRTNDISLDMAQRILWLRKEDPDLMVSIHMNASADPIHISGTSTYYRYPGFRPLSQDIYSQMQALGLKGFGNVGSFNFALNGPTEFPNALVECLFITNPSDEMKILDPNFRQKVAQAILVGIRNFITRPDQPG